MSDKSRTLASVLFSKLGGNVDHSLETILLETIDNALDASATKVSIKINDSNKDKQYLEILDNGEGIKNIDNVLLANNGKLGKIGCKNQGLADTVVHLSQLTGMLDILTNHKNIIKGLRVKFDRMQNEYQRQIKENAEDIDYIALQSKLNYSEFDESECITLFEPTEETLTFIQKGGTLIRIPIHPELDISSMRSIKTGFFQYQYNRLFTLDYLDNTTIEINDKISILEEDKHVPLEFSGELFTHSNGEKRYKISNNYSSVEEYIKRSSKAGNSSIIEKETFEKGITEF